MYPLGMTARLPVVYARWLLTLPSRKMVSRGDSTMFGAGTTTLTGALQDASAIG